MADQEQDTSWHRRGEDAVAKVLKEADRLDVERVRMCHGQPRCDRPFGTPMDRECRYCYVFFDDDKRTAAEIFAGMEASH